ncbi:MAG: hypothetical protein J6Q80_05680 [Lentisphaeria bacterium]|nr:hypothetical protein [Lentisphaeria bacterium]
MGNFDSNYIIYIRESDGRRTMFSAGELRDRLTECLEGDGTTADDITLAVEYSLLNRQSDNNESLYDRGEIDAAVVKLLEETGFTWAAERYRASGEVEENDITTSHTAIYGLLYRHLGCPENKLMQLTEYVVAAARKLEISRGSMHLYLELARHYLKNMTPEDMPDIGELPRVDDRKIEQLGSLLSGRSAELYRSGVFSIEGMTAIFPCVRFHVSMEKFSSFYAVEYPVTELVVEPQAGEVGSAIEECRLKLQMEGNGRLPCTLTVHDLQRFVRDGFDCTDEIQLNEIALELAEIFSGSTGKNLFKLDFD